MGDEIYILGAGPMAREVLGIYKDLDKVAKIGGFIEENCNRCTSEIHNKKVMDAGIIETLPKETKFVAGIGSPQRDRWIKELEQKGFDFDTVTHPSLIKGNFVMIERGCVICPGVVLTCDIKIGAHSIVNIGSTINHDCEIGKFTTIGPSVNIAGNVRIGGRVCVGIGTTIIDKVSIGSGTFIGAGAVVTEDLPENVLAVGFPAKPVKKLSEKDWESLI